jgi:hypothetical protein
MSRSSHMPSPPSCNPVWSMLASQSLMGPMRLASSISRDSSVGRASVRRSEGPWFEPGPRHFLACSLHVLSKAQTCCSFWFAAVLLQVSHVSFLSEDDANLVACLASAEASAYTGNGRAHGCLWGVC